jgi:transcriptional regulator with XRE-family HTH domain
MKDLTNRIRHARRKATLSQSALATALGINRSAVAQWERQGGSTPTSGNLSKIAVATRIHFEWLATGRGPMGSRGADDLPMPLLQLFAHDEVEERLLRASRGLESWQSLAIAEMAEAMARGRPVR